jgi:hypothetical protein
MGRIRKASRLMVKFVLELFLCRSLPSVLFLFFRTIDWFFELK